MDHPTSPSPIDRPAKRQCRVSQAPEDEPKLENQIAIMDIIGHWITPDFEKRDELLEFTEINGPHSGENLAEVVLKMLAELDIAPKLLTITWDNAGNNGTLCDSLHDQLLKRYDNDDGRFRIRPLMRFRGRQSFIPCLAHIINVLFLSVGANITLFFLLICDLPVTNSRIKKMSCC
ncbi:hypothetical protein N7491_000946 [Penicillium cf. griseofulvum]|uniref:DUF659 domain-containing protein n=1 Tax=Penicillium cf. griseofulvum TaxID=2972120 RepID=A0A9W9M8W7_9EURO|nr:hypothetical protein N7472_006081 [Penicillium cf. griseofulvum]KAJ5444864.1 hypothetical protein N7491_000946 [Penicillium cf. griseofulvum]KAJ5446579.1 hypothetical protein N7445_001400 [Penicillium cf. griseofulvum]